MESSVLRELVLPSIRDGEDKSSPFKNCLRKSYRHLRKWAKRTETNSFRLYDRDLFHYPIAIDFYAGRFCVHYFSPSRESCDPPSFLRQEVTETLKALFSVEEQAIFWRTRAKNKKTRQYEKLAESKEFFTVLEYGAKFWVNLVDYLDTGLFLDHRETRHFVASQAKGKRLLNLFAYTSSFSVQAALAGALYTKSVDMSNTYTAWSRENFILNEISAKDHPVVRADCLRFLKEEIHSGERYDLIVIDPPTISRSKKMETLFDVQVDYIFLIHAGLKLLSEGGSLFFSTNSKKFKFDEEVFRGASIREVTKKTESIDFEGRNMHRCWMIKK